MKTESVARSLVLGVGNVLLKDEGVGIHAVEEIRRRFVVPGDVELLDGGTAGVELLRFLDGRENLIVVDAIAGGQAPGTVVRVEGEDVPRMFHIRISPHQIGLSDVLATAMISDTILPKSMVMFGIEPKDMTTGLELTPEVEGALDKLVGAVVDELRSLGHELAEQPEPKPRKLAWEPTK